MLILYGDGVAVSWLWRAAGRSPLASWGSGGSVETESAACHVAPACGSLRSRVFSLPDERPTIPLQLEKPVLGMGTGRGRGGLCDITQFGLISSIRGPTGRARFQAVA